MQVFSQIAQTEVAYYPLWGFEKRGKRKKKVTLTSSAREFDASGVGYAGRRCVAYHRAVHQIHFIRRLREPGLGFRSTLPTPGRVHRGWPDWPPLSPGRPTGPAPHLALTPPITNSLRTLFTTTSHSSRMDRCANRGVRFRKSRSRRLSDSRALKLRIAPTLPGFMSRFVICTV